MNNYMVQIRSKAAFSMHETQSAACKEAQIVANKEGYASVVLLVKEFTRQPQTVTKDIDEVLEDLRGRGVMGDYTYAVVDQLKKSGARTLELPASQSRT